jgi:hypothetical protein
MSRRQSKSFYGSSIGSRDFVITERQYPGGCTTPVHAHERPLFCLVLHGVAEPVRRYAA